MQEDTREKQVREEFNRWAEAGRGEEMESSHLPIVLPTLELMKLQPGDCVLDVGCGSGWLARRLARAVPQGRVVGVDASDEMVRRARQASAGLSNVSFLVGTAERLPCPDNSFDRIISVESAYYWPSPARGLEGIFRAQAPGGSAWVLINYYRDNPHSHQWSGQLQVPVQLLSAAEWSELFRAAGFTDVHHRRIPDPSPTPATYNGRWFRDAQQWQQFKQEGALLLHGMKPRAARGTR
jgi:arsenite methyltransferase